MSERVVELNRPPAQPTRPSLEFERTPPQDVAAEQSVLGGMLLNKDAIADVVEVLKSGDFYRPAHQLVYDVILDLYGRGEPADPITVSSELSKNGDLGRIGGGTYLHTLMSTVPTAANAGYYAKIVAELAILRRLVEAGTRIVQLGYSAEGEVDDVVDRAQQAIYDVTERRSSEDYTLLEDLMQPTMDELEAIGGRSGAMSGVPTGFVDLDNLTQGLHPGQLIVIAGRPGLGKALALDTCLATPTGWTTMGEVRVGDQLLGADGRPTTVLAATEAMADRPCYAVMFSDGTRIVADAQHQWVTSTRSERRAAGGRRSSVRTTVELADSVRLSTADGGPQHSVTTTLPLDLPERDLPLPPYALGVWLGGGHPDSARLPAADAEIVMYVEAEGDGNWDASLRRLGRLGDRRIPADYLRASLAQRRSLLAGLMDSAGTVATDGTLQLTLPCRQLAQDVQDLVLGLGPCATTTPTTGSGHQGACTVRWTSDERVFRLERKHLSHKESSRRQPAGEAVRWITSVDPVASVPVRCVEVDNRDHLYLASRALVPTHNSTLGLDIARSAAIKSSQAAVIFSLEMSKTEITMRLLSAEARVPLHHMRSGSMTDDDWARLARRMGEVNEAPLYIDDSPNLTMMEIRSKARRLKQRKDLRLIVIDYLQLMTGNKKAESRQQEVSELSRNLKLLAKELEVPVVAMSQLNRGAEQRTDKKPQLSDLRESGCLPASTRVLRADTGAETTMGELFRDAATDVPVWSLDSSLRYVRRHLTHVFSTGTREVFRLRLTSGKTICATANHPFLTYDGWVPLADLQVGTRLAVPRHVPAPEQQRSWPDADVVLLAQLLDKGSCVTPPPTGGATADDKDLPAWLDRLGLRRLSSDEMFVPAEVFGLPKSQIRLFLRHLWAAVGSVTVDRNGRTGRVHYAATSRRLVDDVSLLLLRFGISSRLGVAGADGEPRQLWTLDVSGTQDQSRFLDEIGVHGGRAAGVAQLLAVLQDPIASPTVDTVPVEVWQQVRAVLLDRAPTQRELAAAPGTRCPGSATASRAPARDQLGRVAAVLGDTDLELEATNDVLWDAVVEVVSDGVQEVFDATVLGTHNFVADGIAVHNSIEQDADVVVLLHREDAYEKESPRAGEADFIVAKHRNGPTATITVAFQGHYSRFVDMSPS